MKEAMAITNKAKNCVTEKKNKIDKPLPRHIKKKITRLKSIKF